ncbi:thymidylate kinase [Acanthamoeba castellanii medusavirus]|uniref:dTMP kinase n=1 Tax=Acanthamoeba castellanii medusavirus J1 TaxID=3114988 RepID=A0A3T1CWH8_9VIRU|nr:thymidylate kinase [Acanthamoeba castellanii medusavirus]BBI30181.1 thymidylate kinase [Acanthamoeba castellanii medusavirus J1]
MTTKRGLFIAFEGIDGSGKTTQMQRCAGAIFAADKSNEVLMSREPTRHFRETLARMLANDAAPTAIADGFVQDRRRHVAEIIEPALSSGVHVLCDRYMLSTMAYQSVQGVDADALWDMHAGVLQPDLTIIFHCDPAIAARRLRARGGSDAFDRDDELQRKVHRAYLAMAAYLGIAANMNLEIVDASKSPDDVSAHVSKLVLEFLANNKED